MRLSKHYIESIKVYTKTLNNTYIYIMDNINKKDY